MASSLVDVAVLDASAMIAYLHGEDGDTVVENLLRDPAWACEAHLVNIIEVHYEFLRAGGPSAAQAAVQTLIEDGVRIRRSLGADFWRDVSALKAGHRISLADCFCLALGRARGGQVVTADHHEFDPLIPLGICQIRFIR